MKIKIDERLICIPPHISATWEQIAFLQSEENLESKKFTLIIHLIDGKAVKIPGLESSLIDIAFSAHMKHLEGKSVSNGKDGNQAKALGGFLQQLTGLSPDQLTNIPIRFGISGNLPGMENLEMAFQHNQEQAHSPDMPPEVLEKIVEVAKLMLGGELGAFPKPEPHCNCMHCQLARIIHNMPKNTTTEEEPVSEEDLIFRSWDIKEGGEKMYIVTNPLDSKEHYTVYLGTPVGCTCGQADCEHIKAVLYS